MLLWNIASLRVVFSVEMHYLCRNFVYCKMRRVVNILIICLLCLSSCSTFDKVYKSADISGRYEAAKGYYLEGQYLKASQLLESMITLLKGSDKAEESLIMLARCYYNSGDYETVSQYFRVYYSNYPRGEFAEYARFYSGKSLYEGIAEPELDQSGTHQAISELQLFMEYFPYSEYREESEAMILRMHELLVEKEFLSAKLYYELGDYMAYMGNNYQACIITAQNVLTNHCNTFTVKLCNAFSAFCVFGNMQIAVELMPKMTDFVQYQGSHICFVAPLKFNDFFDSEKNGVFAVKCSCPACTVTKPEIQDNINIRLFVKQL